MWRTVLVSVIIIVIAHYSFQYLKDTLTPRKTKDLAGFQRQKFEEIIRELQEAKHIPSPPMDMETELLEFAQDQLTVDNTIIQGI